MAYSDRVMEKFAKRQEWRRQFVDALWQDEARRPLLDTSGWAILVKCSKGDIRDLFETRKEVLQGCPAMAQKLLRHAIFKRDNVLVRWLVGRAKVKPTAKTLRALAHHMQHSTCCDGALLKAMKKVATLLVQHAECDLGELGEDECPTYARLLRAAILFQKRTRPIEVRTCMLLSKDAIARLIETGDDHTSTAYFLNENLQARFAPEEPEHAKRAQDLFKQLLDSGKVDLNALNEKKWTMLATSLRTIRDKRSNHAQTAVACAQATLLLDAGAKCRLKGVPSARQADDVLRRISPEHPDPRVQSLMIYVYGLTPHIDTPALQ